MSELSTRYQLESFLLTEDSKKQVIYDQTDLHKKIVALLLVEWESLDIVHCPFVLTKKRIFNRISVWKILDATYFPKGVGFERIFVQDLKSFRSLNLPKKFNFFGCLNQGREEHSALSLADKQYLLGIRSKLLKNLRNQMDKVSDLFAGEEHFPLINIESSLQILKKKHSELLGSQVEFIKQMSSSSVQSIFPLHLEQEESLFLCYLNTKVQEEAKKIL